MVTVLTARLWKSRLRYNVLTQKDMKVSALLPKEQGFAENLKEQEKAVDAYIQKLSVALQNCGALLDELEQCIRIGSDRLPRPSGFFIGEELRQEAMREAVRFLRVLEHFHRRLGADMMLFSACYNEGERIRYRAEGRRLQSRQNLPTSKNCFDAPQKERNTEVEKLERAVFVSIRSHRILMDLCRQNIVNFNIRVEKNADLSHQGKECDPTSLRTDFGEFLYAAQAKRRELDELLQILEGKRNL